jgi:dipeptidyl aminopeptidase/acylaminoacyl peptidase
VGTNSGERLKYSARRHADNVVIPVLLIHGDQDSTVEPEQSMLMNQALTKAGKPHELLIIKGADHYYREDDYKRQLFTALDRYLGKYLGPGAPMEAR